MKHTKYKLIALTCEKYFHSLVIASAKWDKFL